MPAWPVSLPAPLIEGYSMNEALPIIRTEMEQGPPRVTRISDVYTTQLTVGVALTASELSTFRTFLDGDANAGADWFDMPIITTNTKQDHRVRILSVNTVRDRTIYRVTLQIETDEHVA